MLVVANHADCSSKFLRNSHSFSLWNNIIRACVCSKLNLFNSVCLNWTLRDQHLIWSSRKVWADKIWQNWETKYSINSLWPSDVIRRHRFESTLAQVMSCGLTAPNHPLNQSWLTITKVLWYSLHDCISTIPEICGSSKILFGSPGANELITWDTSNGCQLAAGNHCA